MKSLAAVFLIVMVLGPFFMCLPLAKATSEAEWMAIPPSYAQTYDNDHDGNLDSLKVQIEADTDHDTGSGSITVHAKGCMYDRYDNTPLTSEMQVDWTIGAPGHVNQEEYSPEMHLRVPNGYTSKEGLSYIRTKTLIYLYDDEWHLEQNGDYNYAPWEIRKNLYPPSNPPGPYDVTINAHCDFESVDTSVAITIDGSPTGYSTPHTFTGLTQTHTFTVPNTDENGHPFKQWSNGQTETTIEIASAETVTAYYKSIMDFDISADPGSSTVEQGHSTTATVRTTPIGEYPYVISLFNSGEPPGVTITFDPSRRTSKYTSTMTVQVASYVPKDTYQITITGIGEDSKAHSTPYTLTVGTPTTTLDGEITNYVVLTPVVTPGTKLQLQVTAKNTGDIRAEYNAYIGNIWDSAGNSAGNAYSESHQIIQLDLGASQTLTLEWTTSSTMLPGAYTGDLHLEMAKPGGGWEKRKDYPKVISFTVKGPTKILFKPPFTGYHSSTNLVNKMGLAHIEVSSNAYESGNGEATTNLVTAFLGAGMVLAQFSFSDKWTCPNSGDYEIRMRSLISGQVQLTNIGAMFGSAAARGETWIVMAVLDETSHSLVLDFHEPLLSAANPDSSLVQRFAQDRALDVATAVAELVMESEILSKAVEAIQLGSSLTQLAVPLADNFNGEYEISASPITLKAGNSYKWFFMMYTSSLVAALGTYEASSQSALTLKLENVEVLPLSVDGKPPMTELTNFPPEITSSRDATFTWIGSDDVTPGDELLYSHWLVGFDGGWSFWSRSTSWQYGNLPDGSYVFKVRATDTSGNIELIGAKSYFLVDTIPPTGSIVIDGCDPYTASTSVTLGLSASDSGSSIAQMLVSNDPAFSVASWENYATSKPWTLTSGDGTKRVYVKYKDNAGLESPAFSEAIILDTTPPTGSIVINSGAACAASTSVDLTLSASDTTSGVGSMCLSNDGLTWSSWEPYATSKSWTLAAGDGTKTVNVQFRDNTGLMSSSYSDSIILDTAPATDSIVFSDFSSLFVANNVRIVYPSDGSMKILGRYPASTSDWLASAFLTIRLVTFAEGLDTDSGFVDQTSGVPLGSRGIGIVSFGGPVVSVPVYYYELYKIAPVIYCYIPGSHVPSEPWSLWYYANGTCIAATATGIDDHHDLFLIEIFKDSEGRNVIIAYGVSGKGTYAAGKYFNYIFPNLASYNVNWIIVKWEDTNGDGFVNAPDQGDTYTVIASSPTFTKIAGISNDTAGQFNTRLSENPNHVQMWTFDERATRLRKTLRYLTAARKIESIIAARPN